MQMITWFPYFSVWILTAFLPAKATEPEAFQILSGCWRAEAQGAVVEERWDNLSGGLMLGTSKTVKDGDVVGFEFLRIAVDGEKVSYTPYINGQEADPFILDCHASNETKLVFVNPLNDFPKTIVYQRTGSVLKVVLLANGDADKSIRFEFKSVSCTH